MGEYGAEVYATPFELIDVRTLTLGSITWIFGRQDFSTAVVLWTTYGIEWTSVPIRGGTPSIITFLNHKNDFVVVFFN